MDFIMFHEKNADDRVLYINYKQIVAFYRKQDKYLDYTVIHTADNGLYYVSESVDYVISMIENMTKSYRSEKKFLNFSKNA